MTGDTDPRRLLRGLETDRVNHPRLLATLAVGVLFLLAAAVLAASVPTLAFRIGFLGALVVLFALTGYVAFLVNDLGERRRGSA